MINIAENGHVKNAETTTAVASTRGMLPEIEKTTTMSEEISDTDNNSDDHTLDAILIKIGQFERFQLYILILISLPMIFNAIFSVTYVFTTSTVDHRCKIPECDTSTSQYYEPWTEWTIPIKDNEFVQCKRYVNKNVSINNEYCVPDNFDRKKSELCPKGEYVFKTKEVTIANEFGIYCDEVWKLSLVGTINNLGQFIGIPLGGYISDRYGRSTSLALAGFLAGFMGLVRSFATSYLFFVSLEFLDTVLSGTLYTTCFIVGVELVGPKRRVMVCSLITIFYAIGEILLAVVARYYQNWRVVLRIVYIPALLQVVFFWILPESVRWLLSQGEEDSAKRILLKAAEVNKRKLSETDINKLIMENRSRMLKCNESKYPLKEAFQSLPWRIINCSFCWIVNVLVYYGISLNTVLLGGDKYVNFILVAAIEIPGFLLPYAIMDRIGRRYSLFSSMTISGICCFLFIFTTSDQYYLQICFFLMGKLAITTSFQVLYFFTSEIFPTNLRNSMLSFCSMMGRFGSMLAPQTPLLSSYNKNAPSVLFAVSAVTSGILTLFFPETTNLVLPSTMTEANRIQSKTKLKIST